ncbi:hypothetical protein C9374_008562 [Naegleria lovaniensis]|uniref:histidine kinase n=1 Tax=Naegleria lovaniensis TaxID=51637 RepID=A0AA88GIZ2_NAELO|nr:uncharacterized protein C9374_008562 [Naegleria lovaniensis]KAG2377940.1 hypothetical protein C9374_008562 [Naegleria lovaniensis]
MPEITSPLAPPPSLASSEQQEQGYAEKALLNHLIELRKSHNKAGITLSVLPIFFALSFCSSGTYWVFLCVAAAEIAFQIALNTIITSTLRGFLATNIVRIFGMILVQILVYMLFGPHFPYHVLSTFKILITTKNFCFNLRFMLLAGFALVLGSCTAMLISFWNWKENMTQLEIGHFYSRLAEVFILQVGVTLGAYMFSDALFKTNQEFTKQQVEIAKEKVRSSEKTKFIANLSHEARNPLHCITGSLQVLHHQFEGEKCVNGCKHCILKNSSISETMEDIKENANLLLHILSSSLQMSSLEIGSTVMKSEPFSIVALVDSLVGLFSHLSHEKKIALHAFCNVSSLPSTLKGDSIRISQVVMNLISNAIKYTKHGYVRVNCDICTEQDLTEFDKNIRSRLAQNSTFVKLECIDTGCGISQDQIHNLFQPFHIIEKHEDIKLGFDQYFKQTENINKLGEGGSSLIYTNRNGLGLSIAKLLVDKMNGQITVKSVANEGTTMTIILPLEKAEGNHDLKIPLEANPTKTAWIIDSDGCFRDVLKCYLKLFQLYHEILEFENSQNIASLLQTTTPDIVFLVESEFERICNECPTLNFVITTDRGARRKYSDSCYLSKPVRFNDLRETLENFIDVDVHKLKNDEETRQFKELDANDNDIKFDEYSVLLADDNDVNRKVLEKMLKIIGFKDIDQAKDGMECFEKYKHKSYNLILLDCVMPILSGKEACEMIRRAERQGNYHTTASIVAVTANTWELKEQLLSQGFDEVAYKPIMLQSFKELLVKVLKSKR